MKYNIGDVVQVKCFTANLREITSFIEFNLSTAIIIDIREENKLDFIYSVMICGKEGKTFYIYEKDIVEKL